MSGRAKDQVARWLLLALMLIVSLAVAGCGARQQQGLEDTMPQDHVSPLGIWRQSASGTQAAGMLPNGETPELKGGPERTLRNPEPLTLAELREKYPSTLIISGPTDRKEVALTFDDAPDSEFTPLVLDELKKAGVKATFFVVGNRVEAHPDIMARIVEEGHIVGNHSYNHANLPKLADAAFREQILRTDKLIEQYTGYIPSYVRPPYGNISEEQLKWLASMHRKVINWNVDSLDWKGLNAEQVTANILDAVKPGSIILQHSGGGEGEDLTGTVQALPVVINKLKEQGYTFVTIPQMISAP